MKFSRDFIQKILLSSNLVEIVSKHTEVSFRNNQFWALCPYPDHKEKTPSFSISEEKQVYYCFGCHKSGNVFTFLKDIRGMGFKESVHFLAERAGISLPTSQREGRESFDSLESNRSLPSSLSRRKELIRLHQLAADFFHQELLRASSHSFVKTYLKKRGLKEGIIKEFQIGWAPSGGSSLLPFFKNQKLSLELAETSGLLRQSKDTKELYDNFRGRFMFPIFSIQGQCVAFGGRASKEEQVPKYLNSPESEIFHKKELLYGLHASVRFIKQEEEVIVVEGYMDFLSLYQRGVKNVVATLGTALSPFHVKKIKNLTSRVLILFDGDVAGGKASKRALSLFLSEGLSPRVLQLPKGLDPDEFLHKNGKKALLLEARRAPDLFFVLVEKEMKAGLQSPSDTLRVIERLFPFLTSVSNPRLKSLHIRELARILNVESSWLSRALVSLQREKKFSSYKRDESQVSSSFEEEERSLSADSREVSSDSDEEGKERIEIKDPFLPAEKPLLHLALMDERCFLEITKEEVLSSLSHKALSQIFDLAKKIYRQNKKNFVKMTSLLMLQVKPERLLTPPPSMRDMEKEEASKLMRDCILRLREVQIQKKCQDLSEKIELASSPEEGQALLRQFIKAKLEEKRKNIF